jgi:hypothetical protein
MNNITIESISLELEEEWELDGNTDSEKAWFNEFRDRLSLSFFSKKPDLPEDITDIHALRKFYRDMITKAKGAIIVVEKEYINSILAVKTIFKFSQNPTGFAYLASYTIPRKDFSFVLKVQCHEHGPTGLREAVILDKVIGKGLVDVETRSGWFFDPYDPDFNAPILSNLADSEEYDEHFPNHPLTRARNTMKMINGNVKFSDDILKAAKFFLKLD